MKRTDTGGYILNCTCSPECTATVEIETFPKADTVLIGFSGDPRDPAEYPFRLSELERALSGN